jgi:hypothetical protein
MSRYPMLDHLAGDFPELNAHGGLMSDQQFMSVAGGLLPIALWGRRHPAIQLS